MLRRWSSRLQATLGSDGARLRLLRGRAFGREQLVCDHTTRVGDVATDLDEVIRALDEALRDVACAHGIAGLRCDVAMGDAWMIYDVIEGDLDAAPRSTADDLVGAALADTADLRREEIAVRWQRLPTRRNFACGLPAAALKALQGVVHRHAVRLGSVTGELVLAYNDRRHHIGQTRSVLAVPRPAGAQLGMLVDGGFAALRFEPLAVNPTALLERGRALMRSAGIEPDDRARFYADETLPESEGTPWIRHVPAGRWSGRIDPRLARRRLDLDLSPTRRKVRPTSWALLVIGVLAVGVTGVQFQNASGQHLREARALGALEKSLAESGSAGTPKPSPAEARRARASSAVVKELRVPWGRLFGALEAVSGQDVALLSVEPSAQRQELRLVAEAKSSDAMLDFLEALRAQSLRDVVLVSHQVQAQTPGAPLRFQARAVWEAQ